MPIIKRRYHKPGTPPGTLETPKEFLRKKEIKITVIDYNEEHFEERTVTDVEECFAYLSTNTVTWINVDGLSDVGTIQKLGARFQLHPLSLEGVLNIGQRPKVEDFDSYLFIAVKMLQWNNGEIETEQVSIFLGKNFVITIQEHVGDLFDPIRERLRKGKGVIRKRGSDYLVYSLIDILVDQFFPILEWFGEAIEDVEDELVENPGRQTLQKIHQIKRELLMLRRAAWPERDVISALQREESPLIQETTQVYLRDCYDHTIQIMDVIETYRDLASGMLDVYLSSISNRMNEVMKVLTIIATIFIPLTFIAGIYGMNFNPERSPWNMPELNWYWGYPFAISLMLIVAVIMLIFFRKKRWL